MNRSFSVLLAASLISASAPVFADDTIGAYRDCLKNLETLKKGHWIDGGPHEIAEGIHYSRGNGLGDSISGITSLVDPNGDGKNVYFIAYGKVYKAKTGLVMPEKPKTAEGITSNVKFFKVKSPVNGKLVYVRLNGTNFGGGYTSVRVSSNRVPLAENTETAGPKDPATIELEQVGESEATPIIEKQIAGMIREMPTIYEEWMMNLKWKSSVSPSDADYSDIFRGSPAENAAFQDSLKKEYGKVIKSDYLSGLFPDCNKLSSKTVSTALRETFQKGETARVKYAGGASSESKPQGKKDSAQAR